MAILEMSLIRKWSEMEHARNDSEEFSGNNSNFEIILELPLYETIFRKIIAS